ncbi:MAG: hypothetical protein Q9160_008106 [Pyrenula sp. 1 TL-2023]
MHFADAVTNDLKAQPDIKAYFERFYTISDTPEAHEDYAHSFTDGATLIMASKVAKGQKGRTYMVGYIASAVADFDQKYWNFEKACGRKYPRDIIRLRGCSAQDTAAMAAAAAASK